jgi:hypothetical protein
MKRTYISSLLFVLMLYALHTSKIIYIYIYIYMAIKEIRYEIKKLILTIIYGTKYPLSTPYV